MLLSMTISKRILILSTIILAAVQLAACGNAANCYGDNNSGTKPHIDKPNYNDNSSHDITHIHGNKQNQTVP